MESKASMEPTSKLGGRPHAQLCMNHCSSVRHAICDLVLPSVKSCLCPSAVTLGGTLTLFYRDLESNVLFQKVRKQNIKGICCFSLQRTFQQ